MPFVLDSSVALAWVLPDEQNAAADEIAGRLENDFAVVPAIWPLEILNAFLTASRRSRISQAHMQRLLAELTALPIEVEQTDMKQTLDAIRHLAQHHSTTSYDAAYVELAKRRGLPIATLDQKLKQVCQAERVSVIP